MKGNIIKTQLREFGFLVGFGFPILLGWIIPSLVGHPFRVWTIWIAVPFFFIGILKPILLFYPYKFWQALGLTLGWINSRIIMGLVFFFVVQPTSIIMKCFGYDPLKTKKNDEKSYREEKINHKINLTRIF